MTYCVVSYLFDGRINGVPMRCPKFARNFFNEKKQLGVPCDLLSRDEDNKAVLIDSYRRPPIDAVSKFC